MESTRWRQSANCTRIWKHMQASWRMRARSHWCQRPISWSFRKGWHINIFQQMQTSRLLRKPLLLEAGGSSNQAKMQIEAMESRSLIIWIKFRIASQMSSIEDQNYTRHASYKSTSRSHSWSTGESSISVSLLCSHMSQTLRNQKVYSGDGFTRKATSEQVAKISHSPRVIISSYIWQMMQFRSNPKTMANTKLETK